MLNKFFKGSKNAIALCLAAGPVFTNIFTVNAETPSITNDKPEIHTFDLNNTRIKASEDVYKSILVLEKTLKLSGTLKYKYRAYGYTIQNNGAEVRHIKALNSEDASKTLEDIKKSRAPYVSSLAIIPMSLYMVGCSTLVFPIASQEDYVNIPNEFLNKIMHTPQFAVAITPITTPIGLAGLAASAATVVALVPINQLCMPFASGVAKHNDKLSVTQLQELAFRKSDTLIEVKQGEKISFAILTTSKAHPILIVD